MIEGSARGVKTVAPLTLYLCLIYSTRPLLSEIFIYGVYKIHHHPRSQSSGLTLTFTDIHPELHWSVRAVSTFWFFPSNPTDFVSLQPHPKFPDPASCSETEDSAGNTFMGDAVLEMHREQGRDKWPISQSCPAHQPLRSQVSGSSHTDALIKVVIKV